MSWDDELKSPYIKMKIGDAPVEMVVQEIRKVTNKPKFDFKRKDGSTEGFHYEFQTDKGILTVNTYALRSALRTATINVGCRIKVHRPERGKYVVSLIGAEEITPTKETTEEVPF
ncbi:MAG: hypothetical protein CMI54_03505 [Parcubacteria group bacterium]|jgi:hypothetical protein|nr:hypothetical protein [Parcubacteria group bacterium]|tara:strand:- start:4890 stop:5234 length:345 start_codon:yes stop_codon:yes gene_type:complete